MLCTFSTPSPAYFVSVTSDNRVKVWDVANNTLVSDLAEKDHLKANYSSVAWCPFPSKSKSKRKKRSAGSDDVKDATKLHLVACGTQRGVVVVWDLATGDVKFNLGDGGGGHTKPVLDVAFTPDGKFLVSCAKEKYVLVWNVRTGAVHSKLRMKKHGASRIGVSSDAKVIVAASTIARTFNAATSKRFGPSVAAHSQASSALAVAPDDTLFVTACDRHMSAWPMSSPDAAGSDDDDDDDDDSAALQLFACPAPVSSLAMASTSDGMYRVAAPTADGHCRVWQFSTSSKAKKQLQPACTLSPPAASDRRVFAAVFESGAGASASGTRAGAPADSLTVVQGTLSMPTFDTVSLVGRSGKLLKSITLGDGADAGAGAGAGAKAGAGAGAGASAGSAAAATSSSSSGSGSGSDSDSDSDSDSGARNGGIGSTADAASTNGGPAVLGAVHMPLPVGSMAADGALGSKRRRTDDADVDDDDDAAATADVDGDAVDLDNNPDFAAFEAALEEGGLDVDLDDEDDEDDVDEETMQERLDALTKALEAEDSEADIDDGEDEELAAAERARVAKMVRGAAASTSSLATVLMQALQTNDRAQLELVLAITDVKAIENTVDRLPAAKVVDFLHHVISKFEARPSRGQVLARWIRAVLVKHTAHLMAVPDLVKRLSALYQTIDSRLSVFKKLLTLSGRLDIVLSQVAQQARRASAADGDKGDASGGAPVYVAHEEEDSVGEDGDSSGSDDDSSDGGAGAGADSDDYGSD